jgi:hypothetical protein
MKISEGIIQTIKKTTHHTYWGSRKQFVNFLKDNQYFVLPPFNIESADEEHDILTIKYDDCVVECVITWRDSQHRNGGLIMHDIE